MKFINALVVKLIDTKDLKYNLAQFLKMQIQSIPDKSFINIHYIKKKCAM